MSLMFSYRKLSILKKRYIGEEVSGSVVFVVVLVLYVHGKQLWSCRNGQLT